ncbi:hypothetical protein [Aliarcobacter cryaerophilus]|uniref:hypothetical protein n=1 Tax=Aliarcobacter cryaerophilus TaxID=28198 RepID=UPI003DA5EAB9
MYLLNKTPIFLEFLKRFMSKAGYVFEDENIQNRLFLHSKCNCGQKDCATVYLKSKKPFKKESKRINIFNTNKGFFVVHILDDGFFEFEALLYKKYPYKKEIDKFFNKNRKIDKKLPKIKTKVKEISDKNMKKIDDYFKDLEFLEPNIIDLGEIDFKKKKKKD